MYSIKRFWSFFITLIFAIILTLIIASITKHYFLVLVIMAILMKIFYPKWRGLMGEFWVKLELKKLPRDKYKVLNDIMISLNGMTHQIDHLIISEFGIFVIEMKNFYGYIWGNA